MGGGGGGGGSMNDIFDLFTGGGGRGRSQGPRRSEDVVHKLQVSMEDLYTGVTKWVAAACYHGRNWLHGGGCGIAEHGTCFMHCCLCVEAGASLLDTTASPLYCACFLAGSCRCHGKCRAQSVRARAQNLARSMSARCAQPRRHQHAINQQQQLSCQLWHDVTLANGSMQDAAW